MKNISITVLFITMMVVMVNFPGCGGRKTLTDSTPQQLFEEGKNKYDAEKYTRAIEYFQAIVYNYPGENIVDTAQYYLALSYFGDKEFELAQVEFNRLVVNYPSSVYFTHAIFMKAVSYYENTPKHYGLDQSDLKTAIKQFNDFLLDYPESELIDEAKSYLLIAQSRMAQKFYTNATVYKRMGATQSAEIYYQKVLDDYIDTDYAPSAAFGLAEIKFKRRLYDEAVEKLSDFLIVYPDHILKEEVVKLKEEASFKSAEQAFNENNTEAKIKLESFKKEYPESEKISKVDEYLIQLENRPVVEPEIESENS